MVHPGKSSDLQVSGLQDVGFRFWGLGFRGLGACCGCQVLGVKGSFDCRVHVLQGVAS